VPRVPAWTKVLGVVLFAAAVFWLHHVLGQYHWAPIAARIHGIAGRSLLFAGLLTVSGYASLTLYDVLGVRFAGARIGYPRVALTAFMAYAIGHNIGSNTLSGGAVRYRAYSALGLGAKQIATIVAFGTFTFAVGAAFLLGISLLVDARLTGALAHVPVPLAFALGIALLAGVAAYLVLTAMRREPLRIRSLRLPIPRLRVGLAQLAVSSGDLLSAIGVLFVLLPPGVHVGVAAFVGLYLIAVAVAIVSAVPGGVGVFESVLLLLMPGVPPDRLLGALIVYRAVYYWAPFGAALLLLGMHELWLQRSPLVRFMRLLRTWLITVTPQAVALAVFGAGAVLLLSGATPGRGHRLDLLRGFVPLPVLELSHMLGSAVGVALLVLANGLYRRLDAAWWLTLWLLAAGIVLSLLKGFDYEEALVLAAVGGWLLAARGRFLRRASLLEQHFSASWIVALLVVFAAATWLVGFAYRFVPYANDLWWQFAFEAPAPRSLRAMLFAVMLAAAYGLWRLLRPAAPVLAAPSMADLDRVAEIIDASRDTTANLALLGDKNLLFDAARTGYIMYGISGRSWVSMGDPVGPPAVREELAWAFVELCDGMAAAPVFYQVTPENLPLYVDLGLNLSKLGEEARVPLDSFSLEGAPRAELRQSHRRALRDGARFEVVGRAAVDSILPELGQVSAAWLGDKKTAEKGFSMGLFDPAYLRHFDIAVIRGAAGIVAFANLWRAAAGGESSVDLMRYSESAPKNVIDFLLVECMLWAKAQGFRWFNLGMAPLSGLEEHALAPTWHKLGRLVQRYGENFYHFEGLRRYKEKFQPVWRPRYLAAPGGIAMAGAVIDVTALISGGVTRAMRKD